MSNILYITPHLSTGGLPRYLVMQVLASQKRGDEVWVVEWSNIAPVFRVQKDVLREELGEKLIEWPQGTGDSVKYVGLVGLVKEGNFDTIHMAEFPEGFLPDESIDFIYANSRAYKVYETTHDSAFRLEDKKTKPDKFVFVSDYHAALFAEYGVDIDIIPYVVESKERPDRSAALEKLGLDPLKKHVLNVGLFTPGKNQGEMVKIACALWGESVQFHFVGNQAGNFKDYWEPLNKTLTSNCTLWGERSDVDTFYGCMDLLLFTSKSELMPLVPIEALSHGMPVLMYQDSIYGGRFDGLVEWLGSSVEENSQKVLEILELSKKLNIKLIHLLTRIEDKREQASVKSLERVQDYGIDYIQYINKPEEVYPQDIPALQIHREKKPGYYGAYKAFRDGIETSFDKDTDLLIVCECDCILGVEPGELAALLWRLSRVDFDYLSLGQTEWSTRLGDITEECFLTDKIILAHCVVFPQKSRDFILSQYSTLAWDSPDLWLDYAFTGKRKVVLEKPVAFQHSGFSLIDKEEKSGEYRIDNTNKDVTCAYSFMKQAKVSIKGDSDKEYTVEFIDQDTDKVIFKSLIKTWHWAATNRSYYTRWLVRVSADGELVSEHYLDLAGKRVLMSLGSKSLGDTLAWFPYFEKFAQLHSCSVVVSTFWNSLFIKEYPEIEFINPGDSVDSISAMYEIGCYDDDDGNRHKEEWRKIPMQQIATDILGLDYEECRPRVVIPALERTQEREYVCISEHSTLGCKYWNRPGGWQVLVDEIKQMGLDVMVVSKEKTKLKHVRRCTGKPIEETIRNIHYAKAFIGVGSGLSWLAWALDVPVVMISGFSEMFCEFAESAKVSRIINTEVCHGCFNDIEYPFDRGDWNWCPRSGDFECTKSIEPKQVMEGLRKVLG